MGEIQYCKRVGAFIGGVEKRSVIDTGAPELEDSLKYHPYSKTEPLKPGQGIVAQLGRAGVRP